MGKWEDREWTPAHEAALMRANGATPIPVAEVAPVPPSIVPAGFGLSARLALISVLTRAGRDVTLPQLGTWSRAEMGSAYLWAIAFLSGREDVPRPLHVP